MKINIETTFSVGDKVWAILYGWNCDKNSLRDSRMRLVEKKVVAVRFYHDRNEDHVSYFLEGLHCYEGENWFDDPTELNNDFEKWLYEERIFLNREDAERCYAEYEKSERERENEEDDRD